MKMERIITKDGSVTIFLPDLKEHYHSVHGAVKESRHVFIEQGLRQMRSEHVHIFEMGFGTGLNALLSWIEAEKKHTPITYHAIELHPLPQAVIRKLNYQEILADNTAGKLQMLHSARWNRETPLSPFFTLMKICGNLLEYAPNNSYHLIYFDAFSPEKQPELWEKRIFSKMYQALLPGGILTTYCAKGKVKRTLREVGFIVETLPGPPGKREMIRAVKPGL